MAPTSPPPTRSAPQPCWKTATITPNAAAIDSRLSSTETAAIVTERKATSISRNAITITKRITGTIERWSWALKSSEKAS